MSLMPFHISVPVTDLASARKYIIEIKAEPPHGLFAKEKRVESAGRQR